MKELTQRQKEILMVATDIIADLGIHKMTMKKISEHIGVSEPAIYRHFKSKTNLLLSILQYYSFDIEKTLLDIKNREIGSIEKLNLIFSTYLEKFDENKSLSSIIFSEESFKSSPALTQEIIRILVFNQMIFTDILSQGQKRSEIRDDLPVEHLIWVILGALNFLVKKWRLHQYTFNIIEEGATLQKTIHKMITVDDD